jgi:hypothetical protein
MMMMMVDAVAVAAAAAAATVGNSVIDVLRNREESAETTPAKKLCILLLILLPFCHTFFRHDDVSLSLSLRPLCLTTNLSRQKLLDSKAASVYKLAKKDWRGTRFFHLLPCGRKREYKERRALRRLTLNKNRSSVSSSKDDDDEDEDEDLDDEEEEDDLEEEDALDGEKYVVGLVDDPSLGRGRFAQVVAMC